MNRLLPMRMVLVLLGLGLAGCGTGVVTDQGLSKACVADADCAPAFFGDVCTPCACANGAIAVSSRSKYQQEVTAAKQWCGPQEAVRCAPCREPLVRCESGTCALVP